MDTIYFSLSILLICIAHFLRVIRWGLLINIYEKPDKRILLRSLAYGYLVNFILPFKLGELVRAWIAGKKMKNGKALSFSTVIVDRYLDLICVGVIYFLIDFLSADTKILYRESIVYLIISFVLLGTIYLVEKWNRRIKRVVQSLASIFNERIETSLLLFVWAFICNFKNIFLKIDKIKLIVVTTCMWGGYVASYLMFTFFLNAKGFDASWINLFNMLFAGNVLSKSYGSIIQNSRAFISSDFLHVIIYIIAPALILLLVSCLFSDTGTVENDKINNYLRLLPHVNPRERLEFLERYFLSENKISINDYLKINQNISIIRDYSASSNAMTLLCTDGTSVFFRKNAFGEDGEKLYQQILWIENNTNKIPLPDILKKQKTELYCYYDMTYKSGSISLFEYVHSMPIDKGWEMIKQVIECLERNIYNSNNKSSDRDTIHNYIYTKVEKNIKKIKFDDRIQELLKYDIVFINGVECKNLSLVEKYLKEDYLQDVFKNDFYSTIHGDLTIENIICTKNEKGEDDFYIIDPNTGNVHDSPNLDYAKMLQSLHGGYEFLRTTNSVKILENHIDFQFLKSSVYFELHKRFNAYMNRMLGKERTRSIYFHEIIHWLRLMPYKLEKEDDSAVVIYFAGLLLVVNEVIAMYGDN